MELHPQQTQPAASQPAVENQDRSYILSVVLAYFAGGFGVDRFYLGHIGTGVAKLLTFGGLGIWAYVDNWLVTFGKLRAKNDPRPLQGYAEYGHVTKIIMGVWLSLQLLFLPIAITMLIVFVSVPKLQENSRTVELKSQLATVQTSLETYASNNSGRYPTTEYFNTFFDQFISIDNLQLTRHNVSYAATPEGCDNRATICGGYSLSAQPDSGTTITVTN